MSAAIGPAIGLGSSLVGGLLGSSASDKAAAQQAQAQQRVIDNTGVAVGDAKTGVAEATSAGQKQLSDASQQILQLLQPYIAQGGTSLDSLQQLASAGGGLDKQFSFNPTDLQNDPGYAFTLSEGQKAIQRSQAAKGGLFSSGTLKSLAGYTTGTASQYFNDAYQRAASTFQLNRQSALDRVNTLQDLAKLSYSGTTAAVNSTGDLASKISSTGLSGANSLADIGLKGTQMQNQAVTGQGNSQAAGTIGGANAWSSAIGSGTKAINDYLATKFKPTYGSSTGSRSLINGGAGPAYGG